VTEQPVSGTITGDTGAHGIDAQTGMAHEPEGHHGRPASWVAVSIIIIGFCVGGIALPIGPTWWLFWVGAAIVVIGGIIAGAVHILDDWY
jgi:hypothetical protein